MVKNGSKVPTLFWNLCLGHLLVSYCSRNKCRESKSCQVTKIFNKILIPSYNGNISIVQWLDSNTIFSWGPIIVINCYVWHPQPALPLWEHHYLICVESGSSFLNTFPQVLYSESTVNTLEQTLSVLKDDLVLV